MTASCDACGRHRRLVVAREDVPGERRCVDAAECDRARDAERARLELSDDRELERRVSP